MGEEEMIRCKCETRLGRTAASIPSESDAISLNEVERFELGTFHLRLRNPTDLALDAIRSRKSIFEDRK